MTTQTFRAGAHMHTGRYDFDLFFYTEGEHVAMQRLGLANNFDSLRCSVEFWKHCPSIRPLFAV